MIIKTVNSLSITVVLCGIFAVLLMAFVEAHPIAAREIELAWPKIEDDEAVDMGQLVEVLAPATQAVERKQECEVTL